MTNDKAAPHTEDATVKGGSESISAAEFFESVPPNQVTAISEMFERRVDIPGNTRAFKIPELFLHCPDEICKGNRVFRCESERITAKVGNTRYFFIYFRCSNCQKSMKTFAISVYRNKDGSNSGKCIKFGEHPPFGPPVSSRLISLVGSDRDLFLQGRRCENQGLGIGAFTYYRRVVENQKARIFDEVIKVARRLAAPEDDIAELEGAKNEVQFKKSLSMVKNGMPQALLINGHNPMALLHRALSEGVHNKNDDECLELASSIRVVLSEFSDRLGQALKDEAELKHAIGRLLGSNNQGDAK